MAREWFAKRRIGDLPRMAAERWGEHIAIVCEERRWTYEEMSREVDVVAKGLIAIGVQPGDRVALLMTNVAEFVFAFYAIVKAGAVVVPLNTRYRSVDLEVALRRAECSTLLFIAKSGPIDYLALVREARALSVSREASGYDVWRLVVLGQSAPEAIGWTDMREQGAAVSDDRLAERAASVLPDEMAMIIYTSGTTASPKGVMHSHAGLRSCLERAYLWEMTSADAQVVFTPLFHLLALTAMLTSVMTGSRLVICPMFEPNAVLEKIAAERGTIIHGIDTHYRDLARARARAGILLPDLRLGTCATGSEASIPTAYAAQELCHTVSGYGTTECWSFCALSFIRSSEEQRCEASGFPMPDVEFRITNPDSGREAPTGAAGEIWVRSYCNMLGYYNDEEATGAVLHDGWLRTGDRGLIRPDGHLRFLGRLKDMLRVGGENVSPAEVESFLSSVAGVEDVAVLGIPDDRLGEVPVAFVVATDTSAEAIQEACRGKLASFKIPRQVHFVATLPRNATGRVEKTKLRAALPS